MFVDGIISFPIVPPVPALLKSLKINVYIPFPIPIMSLPLALLKSLKTNGLTRNTMVISGVERTVYVNER